MSKLAGKKRPLDAAEKAILSTKKKIKSTNVCTSCCFFADAHVHSACRTHLICMEIAQEILAQVAKLCLLVKKEPAKAK